MGGDVGEGVGGTDNFGTEGTRGGAVAAATVPTVWPLPIPRDPSSARGSIGSAMAFRVGGPPTRSRAAMPSAWLGAPPRNLKGERKYINRTAVCAPTPPPFPPQPKMAP